MNKEDWKNFEYIGKILRKERNYHHFLWFKSTASIRDFFLIYRTNLVEQGILKEPEDIFLFWLPEIYRLEKDDLAKKKPERLYLLERNIGKKYYEHIR